MHEVLPRTPSPHQAALKESRSRAQRSIALLLGLLAAAVPPAGAQSLGPLLVDVRLVASDTLSDVARTVVERGRPTIYYSPTLLDHVGPRLARFFMAHEYGHIVRGHTGGALGAEDPGLPNGRRSQELEADCYAARQLVAVDPADVLAAIRFFTLSGNFRFDGLHPSGNQRAARIADCADLGPPRSAGTWSGQVTITAPVASTAPYHSEARLWIDQVPVGTVSNLRAAAGTITLRNLEPGVHEYAIALQTYYLDWGLQVTAGGTVEGRGSVLVPEGGRLEVEWVPGEAPRLEAIPGCTDPSHWEPRSGAAPWSLRAAERRSTLVIASRESAKQSPADRSDTGRLLRGRRPLAMTVPRAPCHQSLVMAPSSPSANDPFARGNRCTDCSSP